MRWRTPVGLPVVQVCLAFGLLRARFVDRALQPYRKRGKRSVQTVLQTFTVACVSAACIAGAAAAGSPLAYVFRVQADYLPVIKTKQRTAFPPNYIHSLDSAHMMLTAIACAKAGGWPLRLPQPRLR